jgi:hypothetical protein
MQGVQHEHLRLYCQRNSGVRFLRLAGNGWVSYVFLYLFNLLV